MPGSAWERAVTRIRPLEDSLVTLVETAVACCAPLSAPVLDEDEAVATAALFKALADPAGCGS